MVLRVGPKLPPECGLFVALACQLAERILQSGWACANCGRPVAHGPTRGSRLWCSRETCRRALARVLQSESRARRKRV